MTNQPDNAADPNPDTASPYQPAAADKLHGDTPVTSSWGPGYHRYALPRRSRVSAAT